MTPGKTIAWTRWTFVSKVMSLLFNMLSRLVITFIPRSKCLWISWLQSPSAVILELPKISQPLFPLFPLLFAMKWWDWVPWSSFSECWALSQLFHSPPRPIQLESLKHVSRYLFSFVFKEELRTLTHYLTQYLAQSRPSSHVNLHEWHKTRSLWRRWSLLNYPEGRTETGGNRRVTWTEGIL